MVYTIYNHRILYPMRLMYSGLNSLRVDGCAGCIFNPWTKTFAVAVRHGFIHAGSSSQLVCV